MLGWLRKKLADGDSSESGRMQQSGAVAKSRLQFVLVQDRTGLTPEDMASFKQDMIEVISRFFVLSEREIDISYEREGDSTTLTISSPLLKRRETPLVSTKKAAKNGAPKGSPAKDAKSAQKPVQDKKSATDSTDPSKDENVLKLDKASEVKDKASAVEDDSTKKSANT